MKTYLLYLTCWIQAKIKQGNSLSISLGKRPPIIKKRYLPGQKIICFDTIKNSNQIPILTINYNNETQTINLNKNRLSNPIIKQLNNSKIYINIELLENTDKIYDKYCSQRNDQEKLNYCQGINDFIRSSAQFSSMFQKNKEIATIKQWQDQQRQCQKIISQKIIKVKKVNLATQKILFVIIIFFLIGFLIGNVFQFSHQPKKVRKQKIKKVQSKKH